MRGCALLIVVMFLMRLHAHGDIRDIILGLEAGTRVLRDIERWKALLSVVCTDSDDFGQIEFTGIGNVCQGFRLSLRVRYEGERAGFHRVWRFLRRLSQR